MQIIWSDSAKLERAAIIDYIASHDPDAALRLDARISEVVGRLIHFPRLGHTGRKPGTREILIVSQYTVVYTVKPKQVEIVRIIHNARFFAANG